MFSTEFIPSLSLTTARCLQERPTLLNRRFDFVRCIWNLNELTNWWSSFVLWADPSIPDPNTNNYSKTNEQTVRGMYLALYITISVFVIISLKIRSPNTDDIFVKQRAGSPLCKGFELFLFVWYVWKCSTCYFNNGSYQPAQVNKSQLFRGSKANLSAIEPNMYAARQSLITVPMLRLTGYCCCRGFI